MHRSHLRVAVPPALSALALLAACSHGGDAAADVTGDFVVVRTDPAGDGRVFLNDPIRVDFSNPIDLDSVDLDSFSFQVLDLTGAPLAEQVAGTFEVDAAAGDTQPGRRLLFVPRLPTTSTFDDGGFRARRIYLARLVGGEARNGTVIRDHGGRGLDLPATLRFSTVDGTTPAQLFRNPLPGGPRRTALAISPEPAGEGVRLSEFGAPPVEIRLHFDQALDPSRANVPVGLETAPAVRDKAARGRVWLEYDDPEFGPNALVPLSSSPPFTTWIPADVELEANDRHGAVLLLRPVGVLPNNAEVRVIVEETLQDIAGESNVGAAGFRRVFGTFRTRRDYGQQFDAIVEDFATADRIDFGAAFAEPLAEVGPGFVRASFPFEGAGTSLDFRPLAREVVLNTNFTQVQPANGVPFNVSGGVFRFRDVTIPASVQVRGTGTNPMVWLVSGDFRVEGELSVDGGSGARVDTLNSANFAKAGGIAQCGGGSGGAGAPGGQVRAERGGVGAGPGQRAGGGGQGGRIACIAGCYTGANYNGDGGGSGGGGGSLATQGDPHYRVAQGPNPLQFQQKAGHGGRGCSQGYGRGLSGGLLRGGEPGPTVFADADPGNDFWGSAIDLHRGRRIAGELPSPIGGGGGGGGGNTCDTRPTAQPPISDMSGGGGGAGGGVLIVKALGEIVVTATGRITANGGDGGGGEQAGTSGEAGGGGGGAGGMVILMSATRIVLHAHGSSGRYRYAEDDFDFVLSADGGFCPVGGFLTTPIARKYPLLVPATYDAKPRGAFGGMGIVQLMTPPGPHAASPAASFDGTNTRLDDNVEVWRGGQRTSGLDKQRLLAWRGFPDAAGEFVDDFGTPTAIGDDEGDIRPSPYLLPVPFAAQSRVRSRWIDTGATRRRPLTAEDDLPRGIVTGGGAEPGPSWSFAGNLDPAQAPGFAPFRVVGSSAVVDYATIGPLAAITGADANAHHDGRPAFCVELAENALGAADRYRHYEAELRDARGAAVGSFRILAHEGRTLLLEPGLTGLPAAATQVQVLAKLFAVETSGTETLGPVRSVGGALLPHANVRIGFAFHQDPAAGAAGRFPTDPNRFLYDLADPAFAAWQQQHGRAPFVQWDVTFDIAFDGTENGLNRVDLAAPRPALRFLRLPMRW
jgi:hypothetical protein